MCVSGTLSFAHWQLVLVVKYLSVCVCVSVVTQCCCKVSVSVCMCVCSEPCADLLSQVALAPSFTRWELSDIEHFQRLDLASFNQLPHNSQLSVSYFLVFLFLNFF